MTTREDITNGPIVVYRNPIEMWFWEGGWAYVLVPIAVAFALLLVWIAWQERKAKQRRKQDWLKMNKAQRESWRYESPRNKFEAKEWEKNT